MTQSGYVVAVLGATGDVGRELQTALRERGFPVREWRLFDADTADATAAVPEIDAPLSGVDQINVDGAEFVFMCATEALSSEWTPRAVAAHATVIDLTQAFSQRADVPVLVPEVNAEALADAVECRVVTSPGPGATALSVVLKPLDDVAQLKRVVVAGYEPVSSAGRAAIEELAQQTRDLLGGRAVEVTAFPQRIAFNLLPQVGTPLPADRTDAEWYMESQTRRLLDLPDLPITVTSVRVPTLFGHGYVVNVETDGPIDAAHAAQVLRKAPGIIVEDTAGSCAPTLVDVIDTEATYVGRIRDDPTVPYGITCWVAIDGLRKGAAVNAVQIAELIVGQAGHS